MFLASFIYSYWHLFLLSVNVLLLVIAYDQSGNQYSEFSRLNDLLADCIWANGEMKARVEPLAKLIQDELLGPIFR